MLPGEDMAQGARDGAHGRVLLGSTKDDPVVERDLVVTVREARVGYDLDEDRSPVDRAASISSNAARIRSNRASDASGTSLRRLL